MAKIGTQIILPEKQQPLELSPETATLVNLTNVRLPIKMFTYGNYSLPFTVPGLQTLREVDGQVKSWPCKPGDEWAAIKIKAARGAIDYGDKHRSEFEITGREIALDIARQSNGDIWGIGHDVTGEIGDETARGFAGIFLADAEKPTSDELFEMRELLKLSDAALVEEGHRTWDQFQKPDYIHEGFKRAARRTGTEAEWLYVVKDQRSLPDCPHCGSKLLKATATVCAVCHRDVIAQDMAASEPANAPEGELAIRVRKDHPAAKASHKQA